MNNKAIGDEKDGKRQFGSNKAQKKILQNQVTETQNVQFYYLFFLELVEGKGKGRVEGKA